MPLSRTVLPGEVAKVPKGPPTCCGAVVDTVSLRVVDTVPGTQANGEAPAASA